LFQFVVIRESSENSKFRLREEFGPLHFGHKKIYKKKGDELVKRMVPIEET